MTDHPHRSNQQFSPCYQFSKLNITDRKTLPQQPPPSPDDGRMFCGQIENPPPLHWPTTIRYSNVSLIMHRGKIIKQNSPMANLMVVAAHNLDHSQLGCPSVATYLVSARRCCRANEARESGSSSIDRKFYRHHKFHRHFGWEQGGLIRRFPL